MENCRAKKVPFKCNTHFHSNIGNLKKKKKLTLLWQPWPTKAYLLDLLLLAIFNTPEQSKEKSRSCSLLEFHSVFLSEVWKAQSQPMRLLAGESQLWVYQDFFYISVTATEPWAHKKGFLRVSQHRTKITPNLPWTVQQHLLLPWHCSPCK